MPLITRGNSYRLVMEHCKYNLSKHSFVSRNVSIWNSLPEDVVMATSVNSFKVKLDKWWSRQEVLYNCRAELSGTGSRSNLQV